MKKLLILALSALIGLCFGSCDAPKETESNESKADSAISSVSPEYSDSSEHQSATDDTGESYEANTSFVEETEVNMETYQNPIMDEHTKNAWEKYGFGDPFVMRHNGKYYLYTSTKDWSPGIKVWVSDDLVSWTYKGICATDAKTTSAYAPEVTYYNGKFYMYTSPAGNGHYVLSADNPLGPFRIITDNLGNSIDGHVFIDDDGKWYFYHADQGGIKGKKMASPTDLSGIEIDLGISVSEGWTEGPMIIKDNGVYYLTYCGNHVWSKGYRIQGATSTNSPLIFKDIDTPILMVNTDTPVWGIGHSSTVLGPDLDTYYIVYHSFVDVPIRAMNIAPIALNGKDFSVAGPSTTPQQKPIGSVIATDSTSLTKDFDYSNAKITKRCLTVQQGGKVLTKDAFTGDKYTAEFNFKSVEELSGILFDYTDDATYGKALFDVKEQKLSIEIYKDGERTFRMKFVLPASFEEKIDFSKLQALKIQKSNGKYTFFFNGLTVCSVNASLSGGKLGITAEKGVATMGHIAISQHADNSSIKEYYKPIEGKLQAINAIENQETAMFDGVSYAVLGEGHVNNYRVNISETAMYDIIFEYRSENESTIEVYKAGECIGKVELPQTGSENKFATLRNISLNQGFGIISFKMVSGKASIRSYEFTKSELLSEKTELQLSSPYYADGNWDISGERLYLSPNSPNFISHGKLLYGNEGWSDYSVSANFSSNTLNMSHGLLIRASNPSLGGAGNDSLAGKYFMQGYYVSITSSGLMFYDLNFDSKPIIRFDAEFTPNVIYNLKVEVIGNTLKAYIDGKFVGEITDKTSPHLNGAVGVMGISTESTVTDLIIQPIESFTE